MSASHSFFFFLASFFLVNLVHSTEFVPCFMWSNKRTNEKVPALNKISQDTFKEDIQHYLQDNALIVIFAEQTLSPEDFAQYDQSGVIFSNLAKLAKSSKVSYLPYVQNPIKALKHLDVTVTEVPLDKLGKGFEIPETDILIVNLIDAKDSENRIDMLKRHDTVISLIYQDLAKKHKNILAILTSRHSSWVASEEVVRSRQARSLLQTNEAVPAPENSEGNEEKTQPKENAPRDAVIPIATGAPFYNGSQVFLYVNNFTYVFNKTNYNATSLTFNINVSNNSYYVLNANAIGSSHNISMAFTFTNSTSAGYWEMQSKVPAIIKNDTVNLEMNLTSAAPIVAPNKFSYHCGDQIFSNNDFKGIFKNFQIQVFFYEQPNITKFNDAYDCVGFTSVPIWSGLFVTSILLIIMTLGITMMMDIRTMDRFDDAKGKTITINAE